jgi:hypothetical protein
MRQIGNVIIPDTGLTTITLPHAATIHNADQLIDGVHLHYAFTAGNPLTQSIDVEIVPNGEPFGDEFIYLSDVVDLKWRESRHVIYRPTPIAPAE